MEDSIVTEHADVTDPPTPPAAALDPNVAPGPAPAPNTTISGWVRRRPSSKWSRTFGALPRRHLTIDYKIRSLYYSHSEDGKEISVPLRFSELLSVEALEISPKSCLWPQSTEVLYGFTLQTTRDVLELLCQSQEEADQWVRVLWHTIRSETALQGKLHPGSPTDKPVASFEPRSGKTPPPELQDPSARGRDPSGKDLHKSSQESPNAEERQGGLLPGPPGPRAARSRSPGSQGVKMEVLDEVKSAEEPSAGMRASDADGAEPVKLALEGISSCDEGGLDTSPADFSVGGQNHDSDSEGSEPPVALADVLLPKYVYVEDEPPDVACVNGRVVSTTTATAAVVSPQATVLQRTQQEPAEGEPSHTIVAPTGVQDAEEVQFDALDAISVTSIGGGGPTVAGAVPLGSQEGLRYVDESHTTQHAEAEPAQVHEVHTGIAAEADDSRKPEPLHEEIDTAERSTAVTTPATVEGGSPESLEAADHLVAETLAEATPAAKDEEEPAAPDDKAEMPEHEQSPTPDADAVPASAEDVSATLRPAEEPVNRSPETADLNVQATAPNGLEANGMVDGKSEDDVQSISPMNSARKSQNSESGESSVAGGRHGLSTPDRLLADVSSKPSHHGAKTAFHPPSRLAVVRDEAE